jgi:hypothetical protein
LILARNKKWRHTTTKATANLLMDSLGGGNAIKNKRPICGGQYNSTEGLKVLYLVLQSFNHLYAGYTLYSFMLRCHNALGRYRRCVM